MEEKQNFIYDLPIEPRLLIEANAGTGKTYTIVGIFVRLLIEKKVTVDQILVVTFTRKATAELRGRILNRLRSCLSALTERKESIDEDDAFLNEFLNRTEDRTDAINRLKAAVQNFDESNVLTIHGFCQKVLKEAALYTKTPFDLEVTQRDHLLDRAVEDCWRIFMDRYSSTEPGKYYITKLLKIAETPDSLKNVLISLLRKPYARIEAETLDNPVEFLENVLELKNEMREVWESEREVLEEIFQTTGISRYQQHLESRKKKLVDFLYDDTYSSDTFKQLSYFTSEYLYDDGNLKNNGQPTKEHHFFDLCQQYSDLVSDIGRVSTTILYRFNQEIKKQRELLVKSSGEITYDDLLNTMENALLREEGSSELRAELLEKYPFALVDEFQDTDPVQYNIFDSIYPESSGNHSLMMIGDPKQAIYGFRGADVYTYLKAKKGNTEDVHRLDKNFRSTPGLIEAINQIFAGDKNSFIEDRIQFEPSRPGKNEPKPGLLLNGSESAPLKITAFTGFESNKDSVRNTVYSQTVKEIAGLLEQSEEGRVLIDDKKLEAGDIAVLVSGHKDAEEIKRRLKKVGVDAVTYSRQKVFETFEANRLELVMKAVLNFSNNYAVNNALMSGLFGLKLDQLYELKENEKQNRELREFLEDLQDRWQQKGFYSMFRKLMIHNNRISELADLENAERVFTNLFHLADVCSRAELEGKLDPVSLHTWFCKEMTAGDEDDENTLLLESDQNLVKISTIHNSKGLEFPVVFCPTLWQGFDNSKKLLVEYHGEETDDSIINISQTDSEQRNEAVLNSRIESVAEEVRKTYVALTRAKYECRIIWKAHTNSNLSGLGAVLLGREKFIKYQDEKVKEDRELSDEMFTEALEDLEDSKLIGVTFLKESELEPRTERVRWKESRKSELYAHTYNGRGKLPVMHISESFSSLVHHKSPGEPDYDQFLEEYDDALQVKQEAKKELNIFTFPRGATAGTAMHKLFEDPKFEFNAAANTSHTEIIHDVFERYGFDEKWVSVIEQMMKNVAGAKVGPLKMANIESGDYISEMEFHFSSAKVKSDELFEIIRNDSNPVISDEKVKCYMTGFIDLVVRQNGKYYIIDYKSNHLGDSYEDYSEENMEKEILAAGYDLQYHLYTAALEKYLRKKIKDFDYERDFGGAGYLFLRGIKPGSETGIWFHKPDLSVIEKLEIGLGR